MSDWQNNSVQISIIKGGFTWTDIRRTGLIKNGSMLAHLARYIHTNRLDTLFTVSGVGIKDDIDVPNLQANEDNQQFS